MNKKWQNYTHRVHDCPITENGIGQARKCAEYIGKRLDGSKKTKIICLSSPFIRCIMTARTILTTLGVENEVTIKVEQGLCEANNCLHALMMAKNKDSKLINPLTGQKRGMIYPVLLGPGDLQEIAKPCEIDDEHDSLHQVRYTPDCFEILKSENQKSILPYSKRVKEFLPKFLAWLKDVDGDNEDVEVFCLLVTHRAIACEISEQLVGHPVKDVFGYCACATLDRNHIALNDFSLERIWNLEDEH